MHFIENIKIFLKAFILKKELLFLNELPTHSCLCPINYYYEKLEL